MGLTESIPPVQIPGIDLFGHVIQGAVIPVGDNGPAAPFELFQVIDHPAPEEGAAVF